MNKLMSFPEIKKDILSCDYKRTALYDKNANLLIPWNSKNVPIASRLQEVEKRLQSKAMRAGIYQVHAKHFDTNSLPSIYYVQVGDLDESLADIEIKSEFPMTKKDEQLPAANGFVSLTQYNDLYLECLQLRSDNTRLQNDIETLQDEIEALQDEIDTTPKDSGGLLSDGNKQFFQSLAETAVPLLDRMLEQRDKALNIRVLELDQMNRTTTPPQAAPQKFTPMSDQVQDDELSEHEEKVLDALAHLQETQPEIYAEMISKLETHYNQNEDI